MATEIGIVKTLIGTAVATAADGSQRNLQAGDRVYVDEVITTGAAGAIEIEFTDGSVMDLGRSSQALLDSDVFDPLQIAEVETEADIAALQQALLDGEDPSQVSDPTAAGPESEGNEGVTTVVVDHLAPVIEVTSGFDTGNLPQNGLNGNNVLGQFGGAGARSAALAVNIDPTSTGIAAQDSNDSDNINFDVSGSFNDADGNALTFSATGLPSGLSISAAGVISGVLDSSASQTGPYNIVVTADDGNGGTISSAFAWNITNPAPEADDDTATLDEDTTYNGSVSGNDVDPDGDLVSYNLDTDVSNGVLVFNSDGSYTYTPNLNYNGPDSFTYIITDADGATDTATVTLTIVDVNDPTITSSDTDSTNEDATLTVNAVNGVLSNDTDADDVLSVASFAVDIDGDGTDESFFADAIANIAGVGTLQINNDGSYEFIPAADYDGAVPVATYTTNTGASDTLTLSIAGINDAPVTAADAGTFNEDQLSEPAVPQTGSENLLDGLTDVDDVAGHFIGTVSDDGGSYQTIVSNGSIQIKVEFEFTDKNGDPQTIFIPVLVDADGEYHVSQSGLLDAIPVGNAATGSFFYQINDGHAVNNLSAPQEFMITINGENDAPEFNVTSLANDGDIPVIVKLSGDSFNASGQDAPRFIVSVDGVALNGGNSLTIEELRSYNIDTPLGSEPRETSWEYVTFNVPTGTTSVAIQFVNDAWEGGSDNDGDGYAEDRNLIIDYVNVGGEITGSGDAVTVTGGTTLQAEDPAVSTYLTSGGSDRSGREVMPWSGTMTFDVENAVDNAVSTNAFQTENFAEDALSSQANVTGTVSLLEGVSDIDDVVSVITVGTVNGNAGTVGTPFNLDLSYDDGSGPQTITVQVTVAADGSYQLTNTAALNALPEGVIASGSFQFQAQDDSNDLSETQTFTINVLGDNDAPTIIVDTGNSANANDVVLEAGLVSGSNPQATDRTAQGSFTIGDADGLSDIASLSLSGTTFVIGAGGGEFTDFAAMVGQTVSAISGDVTLTSYTNGTFTYSYELTSATTDVAAVTETDSFDIAVSDGSTTSPSVTVTIEITDDVPTITETASMAITHDETIGIDADADDAALPPPSFIISPTSNPSGVAEVNLSTLMTFNAGADGLQTISFTDVSGGVLTHVDSGLTDLAGEIIYLHSQANGSIVGMVDPDPALTYIEGPPVVFTLLIDSSGAQPVVRFNQFLPIQHPDDSSADETVSITDLIYISVTDGDGDIVTTNNALTVSIQDDAPILTADTNAADAVKEDVDTSSQGNVLSNDISFDGAVVSSIEFAGTTAVVAAGSFAVIDGVYGSLLSNANGVYSYTLNGAQNNVQSLAEGEVVTEEFTYTVQDGDGDTASSILTITITGTNDAPVIDSAVSDLSGFAFNGLNAEYYGENGQLSTIAQFRAIVDSRVPDATFRSTEVSYSQAGGTVSQGENLQSFINGDAATLSADPDSASDGGLHMFGQVYLDAGDYVFRVRADDGYQITIDGNSVGEFDGNQGPTTRTHSLFTVASDGYYDVDIVWWDQGGAYVFEPELSKDGGAFEVFSPANFEFQSQATSSVIEAGVTDSGAIVDGLSIATGSMTATDVDNGAVLTWSVADGAGTYGTLSIDPTSGQWTYVLDNAAADPLAEGETVTEPFTIIVTDEYGATDSEVVTITVQGTNDAPIAFADTGTTAENTSLTIDVLANDTDVDNGDVPATFSLDSVSFAAGAAPTATVNIVANQLVFNPGTDFDYLPNGAMATIIVNYTMSDDSGAISNSMVAINITGTNDGPIAQAEPDFEIFEDAAVVFGQVVATDADDAVLDYSLVGAIPSGLTFNDNGSYDFDPSGAAYQDLAIGETRDVTFSWKAADSSGAETAVGTVTITIKGTNDQPVIPVSAIDVAADEALTGRTTFTGTLPGVTDVDASDGFSYRFVSGSFQFTTSDGSTVPGGGGSLSSSGTYSINGRFDGLAEGATGTVSFQYIADDQNGFDGTDGINESSTSDSVTITLTVTGTNDAPVIQAESDFNAVEDAAIINGQVIATDIDSDDDSASLVYSIDGVTPAGLVFNSNGSYSFDPSDAAYQSLAVGETTTATFSWKATDSHGADSGTDAVTITITGTNDQPVVSDVGSQAITGAIVLNGTLTTSVDYWNFTHNGGDLSIDMLTEISGGNGQNGTNGVGYNEIDGDNTQTSLDVMIRVFALNADGSRGAQVGVNDDNNNPGFDGSLYNRDSFLALNNLPQGEYQLVVGAWNLTAAEVDSGINAVDDAAWHFEGPYQITLNGENGAQLKAKGIAFEAVDGDTLFESNLPAVLDADSSDSHDYSLVATSETFVQSNPLGAAIATPTITVNVDGSYSVSGDFNSLALGETATVTFQYIADDTHGFDGTDGVNESSVSAPATVTVTIQGTNDAPIAFEDVGNAISDGDILITDDFSNVSDWQGKSDGVQLHLTNQDSASEIFDFDVDNAGKTVRLDFDVSTYGSWDISGGLQDDFIVNVNGVQILLTHALGNNHYTLDVQTDLNGQINLQFVTDATGGDEGVNIDNLSISAIGNNWTSSLTTEENTAITIDVLANDTDIDNGDNPTTFSLDSVSFASGVPAIPTATATVVANQLVFNPGTDFDYLAAGETAAVVVNYTMSDDSGAASTSTATITVTGTNDAPIITSPLQSVSFTEVGELDEAPNLSYVGVGTITFSDADVTDTHTASFVPQAVNYLGTFSLDPVNDGTDSVAWTFNVTDTDIDHLDTGDQLTQIYTVAIDDGQGGIDYQDVTVTINGTAEGLVINGDVNPNNLVGGAGDDIITGQGGKDTLFGNDGNDQLFGNSNDDTIFGGEGDDLLDGGHGFDTLHGGAGNDDLIGGQGLDTLYGDEGDDILDGGSGKDTLTGGLGDDILTGGAAKDTFVWNKADVTMPAHDQVTDFDGNVTDPSAFKQDVLNLSDLLADGSHEIAGLSVADASGGGQHLQLSITTTVGGTEVQTIDLNNVAVNVGDNVTDMLNNLLSNGGIDDGL